MPARRDPTRQHHILETLDERGEPTTLADVVAAYCERVGGRPEDEYDATATRLTILKRAGRVQSLKGKWSRLNVGRGADAPQTAMAPVQHHVVREIQASAVLDVVLSELEVSLADVVARSAFWAPKPRSLQPTYRARRKRGGETRGIGADGVRLDDNGFANRAIKNALAPRKFVGFEAAHIWPGTCYDERYHTLVANLVLLPRPIAGMSDHDPHVARCLQYRAYELYGWHPDGEPVPARPERYPVIWRYGDLHPTEVAT